MKGIYEDMEFEPVIGLEVHAQLNTKTKIFCGCSTSFGNKPNTNVCPVCLGMPGSLPVLNKKAVDFTILMALALNCQIQTESIFARKNYFYPDLPKGYQISQYEMPIARNGYIDISIEDHRQRIGINRIHIEEDAGKLSHPKNRPVSLIDFNRTGVPLIEIVSEPDIRSAEAAAHYLRQLRAIVRYLGISDGNLEEGSFRCDANVSIRPKGDCRLGTRTELKNLNSFKFVEKALLYEIKRQIQTIADKGQIVQETRLWDADKNITISMRSKEEAHDYRYFPDPDLVPLVVKEPWIQKIKSDMPELPYEKKQRFISDYSLTEYDAEILTSSREMAKYFEECLKICSKPKQIANWIIGPLLAILNSMCINIENSPVSAKNMAALVQAIEDRVITNNIAKKVFDEMTETGSAPAEIIERKGLVQVSDKTALEPVIDEILEKNRPQVAQYKEGKRKVLGFFVGQVMKKTGGKANPAIVNELLTEKLS